MRAASLSLLAAACARVLAPQLWRQHWDFQLYKALEVQFRAGLHSINQTLPEVGALGRKHCRPPGGDMRAWCTRQHHIHIHPIYAPHTQMEVSLVVRHHTLQYEPPLEELRLAHLTTHLQPFLALPLRMKGVSSLSQRAGFFGAIAHADPAAVAQVGGWGAAACVPWVALRFTLSVTNSAAAHAPRRCTTPARRCLERWMTRHKSTARGWRWAPAGKTWRSRWSSSCGAAARLPLRPRMAVMPAAQATASAQQQWRRHHQHPLAAVWLPGSST
jgi:hypothetical protein